MWKLKPLRFFTINLELRNSRYQLASVSREENGELPVLLPGVPAWSSGAAPGTQEVRLLTGQNASFGLAKPPSSVPESGAVLLQRGVASV